MSKNSVELFNNSFINSYAIMNIIINYINLLPIYPLDGGKILQTLLLSRYPKGQFYFYIIGLTILTVVMVWMRDPLLLEDEKFTNETLASKARIAKQMLTVIEMKKPCKRLMFFGMKSF